MTATDSDDHAALGAWLTAHLDDGEVTVTGMSRPHGGYSAETLIVDAAVSRSTASGPGRFVLRREVDEPPVYPTQIDGIEVEIEWQWRVMSALAEHGDAPIAPLIAYEPDPEVLGNPFFVMGFVDGVVPGEDPNYTAEGFYVDASAEQRSTMIGTGIDAMAAVHAVDVAAAGLEWLSPSGAVDDGPRQVHIWREYAERELDGRPHDLMLAAFDRAEAEIPAGGPSVLTWGDARLGNVIWHDFTPACLTDFEAAALAPPEIDLGWWIMFDQWSHTMGGATVMDGEWSTDAQVERYVATSGHDVDDIAPWVLFAAARYAAIVVRVMNRMVSRGELPVDHNLYIDPIAPTLRSLL